MAGSAVALVERLAACGIAGDPERRVRRWPLLSRPAADMRNNGGHLGVCELGEGRHDPPGAAEAHRFMQVGVIDTRKKGGQGKGDADTPTADSPSAGGGRAR